MSVLVMKTEEMPELQNENLTPKLSCDDSRHDQGQPVHDISSDEQDADGTRSCAVDQLYVDEDEPLLNHKEKRRVDRLVR